MFCDHRLKTSSSRKYFYILNAYDTCWRTERGTQSDASEKQGDKIAWLWNWLSNQLYTLQEDWQLCLSLQKLWNIRKEANISFWTDVPQKYKKGFLFYCFKKLTFSLNVSNIYIYIYPKQKARQQWKKQKCPPLLLGDRKTQKEYGSETLLRFVVKSEQLQWDIFR